MDTTNRRTVLMITAVVIGVLIIGGLTWLIGRTGKQRALQQAFTKLASAQTLHTRAELTINLPTRQRNHQRPFTEITAVIDGDVQRGVNNIPELTGTLNGHAKGEGNIFTLQSEVRVLTDAVAFKLNEFPVLLNPSGSLTRKWTYVNSPLLTTTNPTTVSDALAAALPAFEYRGRDTRHGTRLAHYQATVTPEEEDALTAILAKQTSGNEALHVLARLMNANNIATADLWLNTRTDEIAELKLNFVRPLSNDRTFDFATVTLAFTDYNKPVTIERPPVELTSKPDPFAKLFGRGEITAIQQ